jgi:hypothetical protein
MLCIEKLLMKYILTTCKCVGLCSGVPEISTLLGHDAPSMGGWFPTFWSNVVLIGFRRFETMLFSLQGLMSPKNYCWTFAPLKMRLMMSRIDGNQLPSDAAS